MPVQPCRRLVQVMIPRRCSCTSAVRRSRTGRQGKREPDEAGGAFWLPGNVLLELHMVPPMSRGQNGDAQVMFQPSWFDAMHCTVPQCSPREGRCQSPGLVSCQDNVRRNLYGQDFFAEELCKCFASKAQRVLICSPRQNTVELIKAILRSERSCIAILPGGHGAPRAGQRAMYILLVACQ